MLSSPTLGCEQQALAHRPPEWYLPEARFCSSSSPRSLMRNTEKARCKSGTVWARRLSAVPMGLSNTSTKIRLSSRSVISFLRERKRAAWGTALWNFFYCCPAASLSCWISRRTASTAAWQARAVSCCSGSGRPSFLRSWFQQTFRMQPARASSSVAQTT